MTQRDDNNSYGQFWPGKANKVPDVEIHYLKQMGMPEFSEQKKTH
jgi:hypothetical protein